MNLDNDLRRTFRRTPAPDDFADRVLARIAQPASQDAGSPLASPTCPPQLQRRRKLREGGPRMPMRGWLAAAAVLTLMAVGGARYYFYQQTVAEAERVQAEISVALQITGEKLALVQRKVEDSQR